MLNKIDKLKISRCRQWFEVSKTSYLMMMSLGSQSSHFRARDTEVNFRYLQREVEVRPECGQKHRKTDQEAKETRNQPQYASLG